MDKKINPQLQKHYSRLVVEGTVKSVLGGTAVGFFTVFLIATTEWFFGFGGVLLPLTVGIGIGAICGIALYFLKNRPDVKGVARRVDALGLEERTVTMVEHTNDPSDIAAIQRENALECLDGLGNSKIKFRISRLLSVMTAVAVILGVGMTTVVGLARNDIVPGGGEIFAPVDPFENYIAVYYIAGDGGEIEGESDQLVLPGEGTAPVVAVAEDGYMFIGWNDGFEFPERYDVNIQEECGFTALFTEVEDDGDDSDSDDGNEGEEEGDEAEDAPTSSESDAEDGKEDDGNSGSGDSSEEEKGEEDGKDGSGDSEGLGAAGKWENKNQFIDGNTYYRDYLDIYYEMAMQIFAETGEIPPEMLEFFETYFGGI